MNKPHLTSREINAYLHNTTTDADRECLDQHLARCPHCQIQLWAERQLKSDLAQVIHTAVDDLQPTGTFDFESISVEMQKRSVRSDLQSRLAGVSALAGVALLIISILQMDSSAGDALPIFAYACFTLPMYTVSNSWERTSKQVWTILLSTVLCIGIAILGLFEIYLIQQVAYNTARFFSNNNSIAAAFSGFALMLAACAWVIAVIGNLDFQMKHRTDKNSWHMLRWTLLVEGVILLLSLVF